MITVASGIGVPPGGVKEIVIEPDLIAIWWVVAIRLTAIVVCAEILNG